jgi:hypothetical protein
LGPSLEFLAQHFEISTHINLSSICFKWCFKPSSGLQENRCFVCLYYKHNEWKENMPPKPRTKMLLNHALSYVFLLIIALCLTSKNCLLSWFCFIFLDSFYTCQNLKHYIFNLPWKCHHISLHVYVSCTYLSSICKCAICDSIEMFRSTFLSMTHFYMSAVLTTIITFDFMCNYANFL